MLSVLVYGVMWFCIQLILFTVLGKDCSWYQMYAAHRFGTLYENTAVCFHNYIYLSCITVWNAAG